MAVITVAWTDAYKTILHKVGKKVETTRSFHRLWLRMIYCRWNIKEAIQAAKLKVALMEQIKDDIWTLLPSAYLEMYELLKLSKVPIGKHDVKEIPWNIYIRYVCSRSAMNILWSRFNQCIQRRGNIFKMPSLFLRLSYLVPTLLSPQLSHHLPYLYTNLFSLCVRVPLQIYFPNGCLRNSSSTPCIFCAIKYCIFISCLSYI